MTGIEERSPPLQAKRPDMWDGIWIAQAEEVLLDFLRDLFSQHPRLDGRSGNVGPSFHWEDDDSATELIITEINSLNTDTVGHRPVITLSLEHSQFPRNSLDSFQRGDQEGQQKHRTDLVVQNWNLHCMARQGLMAKRLASVVAQAFRHYDRDLKKAGITSGIERLALGRETGSGEVLGASVVSDHRVVTLNFLTQTQYGWTETAVGTHLARIAGRLVALKRRHDPSLLDPEAVDQDVDPSTVVLAEWSTP